MEDDWLEAAYEDRNGYPDTDSIEDTASDEALALDAEAFGDE